MDVVDAAARDLWVPGPEVSSAHRRQRWPGSNAQSLSGTHRVGKQAWEAWDEPYKVSYREYVHNQVTKDTTTYSLKNAISRSKVFEQLDPGWKSVILAHYGAITMPEYLASIGEARMGRFGRAAAWRNTATFGTLDEVRHGQIQAFFPYGLLPKEPRGDWALKAFHTDNWIILAVRHLFDDMFVANDALSVAIQLTFMLETGFTNLQFLGMAADAIDVGDLEFGALISSIQTDEARHAIHTIIWNYRPSVWWNPDAGVSAVEREWLEEKYPGWNRVFGRHWDVLTQNVRDGKLAETYPETLPVACNICQLPVVRAAGLLVGANTDPASPRYVHEGARDESVEAGRGHHELST